MRDDFVKKFLPLIDKAAKAAQHNARRVITNGHLLWQVYIYEQARLLDDAVKVKKGEPMTNGETMTEDEFETYLLNLAVWVPNPHASEADPENDKNV